MKLIACYNIYNEAKFLEESLNAIRDKVDLIVVVDGAYKKFPHEVPWSTDGSLEIARKYADTLITTKKAWPNEITKRNRYLIGYENDVYIQIDGHEIFHGELKPPFGNYRLRILMKDGPHEFFRMFIHKPGIHYREFHYSLWIGHRCLGQEFPLYEHGFLVHKDNEEPERIKAKQIYYSIPNRDN